MRNSKIKKRAVQAITCYRILAAPVLLLFIWKNQYDLFKWMLAISFFTDAIDGYLARRYKVVSAMGARIDSAGDDLTVIVAVIAMVKWYNDFIWETRIWSVSLIFLLVVQVALAFIKYGKMTAYHTYISKTAAVLQGLFLSSCFLFGNPAASLFYLAIITTGAGLLEEIVITILLRDYRFDVRGLYWLLRAKKK